MRICGYLEELLPFAYYLVRSRSKRELCDSGKILHEKEFIKYKTLSEKQIKHRLDDEHRRAENLDEKTFKLTLSFSVGLTFLGLAAAFLIKSIQIPQIKTLLIVLFFVGIIYTLTAGFTALGGLRTLPRYGYGTHFLLSITQSSDPRTIMANALACQEAMNIVRQLRNEAAYQALRNGLWLLFIGILVFAATLAYQSLDLVLNLP